MIDQLQFSFCYTRCFEALKWTMYIFVAIMFLQKIEDMYVPTIEFFDTLLSDLDVIVIKQKQMEISVFLSFFSFFPHFLLVEF